jgi:hypothetical protein
MIYRIIIDEKKELVFAIKPNLFSISIFFLLIICLKAKDHGPLNIVEAKPIIDISCSNLSNVLQNLNKCRSIKIML